MHEADLTLATEGGAIPVFVTRPEEAGPHPIVILYMDALGIREELKDMARRIGTVGYYVMLPNLFWREGGPSFDPALLPTHGPDPEMMRLNHATTHAMVLADTGALLDHAATDPAARDPVGTIGWCMGGRHALAAAGTFPDRIKAMVSLHAGFQVTDRPDSAHLAVPRITAECYFGFADGDPLSPPEHEAILKEACRSRGVEARFETYPGAAHGFTFPTRYCYDKPSAERAWERTFALFRRRLG
jgi:carboxymethylenebutenolidase